MAEKHTARWKIYDQLCSNRVEGINQTLIPQILVLFIQSVILSFKHLNYTVLVLQRFSQKYLHKIMHFLRESSAYFSFNLWSIHTLRSIQHFLPCGGVFSLWLCWTLFPVGYHYGLQVTHLLNLLPNYLFPICELLKGKHASSSSTCPKNSAKSQARNKSLVFIYGIMVKLTLVKPSY